MSDYTKITKEQFDAASAKYPASKWIKFAYDFFSDNPKEHKFIIKNIVIYVLLTFFFVGFIGTILNVSKNIISIATYVYLIILSILGTYLFSAGTLNWIRLNKIVKELGVTREEYDKLYEKFYGI